ncbi:MAG TPA: DNA repair exonuclease [Neobacillus sp.]|jgi:DNA repair exonuclease SbcCD nuclease subunit
MKGIKMKQISFIHAADLHLDSPMVGLKALPANIYQRIRESTFTALKKITAAAIEHQVDFVIIAGDLFDGEDRSLRAQSRFRTEMNKLSEHNIPVYIIHGNHDHLNGSWVHLEMPANVHVFGPEVETKVVTTKSGATFYLYGFSYPQRHVFERKIDEYLKVEDRIGFHIGILHGNEAGGGDHDNYAPFSTKDLLEKGFDYWALGHIHKRAILSENPPIIYPGNIQGRNKKEKDEKGFYLVTLTESEAKMNFIESSDIIWREVSVDASSARSFHEVFQLCQTAINSLRRINNGVLLTLSLENIQLDDPSEKRSLDSELIELLLEDEKDEESFVWIVDLIVSENIQMDKEKLTSEAKFYAELFDTVNEYDEVESALAPLYEHPLGRKYLTHLSRSARKELVEKAERLLIKSLYQS